ncbi:MAG: c-type cytochrome [Burkholderiales bacterium]
MSRDALVLLTVFFAACGGERSSFEKIGNAEQGRELLWQYGCGVCHEIPEVKGATGKVGPPLKNMAHQVYIAGVLPNTPENLVYWIRAPHKVDPLTAMPDLGVTGEQARDMVAYLYSK